MKNLFVFTLLLSASIATFSQSNLEEVVYLKNGSIIRGVIIEQIPGTSLKIQTKDRNVFSFQMSEIEKMTKELIPADEPAKKEKAKFSIDSVRPKGYCGIYEFGGLFGFTGNNASKDKNFSGDSRSRGHFKFSQPFFTFKTVQGYQLDRKLFLGGGIGFDVRGGQTSSGVNWQAGMAPVFFEVRATLKNKRIAPFISQQTGYAIAFTHDSRSGWGYTTWAETFPGGLHSETKVGFRLMIDKRAAFNFSVGYRMQHLARKYSLVNAVFESQLGGFGWNSSLSNQTSTTPFWVHTFLHFVSVKTGFSF